jgi:DNA-binding beta-propeller fold protein YncE
MKSLRESGNFKTLSFFLLLSFLTVFVILSSLSFPFEQEEDKGEVLIITTPEGASIFIDGEDKGLTPFQGFLKTGKHKVKIEKEGFEPIEREIVVEKGKKNIFDFTLTSLTPAKEIPIEKKAEEKPMVKERMEKPRKSTKLLYIVGGLAVAGLAGYFLLRGGKKEEKFGSIEVSSNPKGAKIYLDGKDTGKVTDALLEKVPVGVHSLKLVLAGFEDYSTNINVSENQTSKVFWNFYRLSLEFVKLWGSYGSGDGQFLHPQGIGVDNLGYVYVADDHNGRVQKFTSEGAFVKKWNIVGRWTDRVHGLSLSIDGGYVYVVASHRYEIQKYTINGDFVLSWDYYPEWNHYLFNLHTYGYGIEVDRFGDVYFSFSHLNHIRKFSSDGKFLSRFGSVGSGDGEFRNPHGLAFDGYGNLYVADTDNHRIQKFTPDGKFLGKWGSRGSKEGEFVSPKDVAVDNLGYVYVTDENNDRIQVFTLDGAFVTASSFPLKKPWGIAVDSSGFIYVTDAENYRVVKFKREIASSFSYDFKTNSMRFSSPYLTSDVLLQPRKINKDKTIDR